MSVAAVAPAVPANPRPPTYTHVVVRRGLTDAALATEVASLARRERAALASLLGHLGEFDARELYAPAGFSSSTTYAVHHFGWSEASAWKRMQAARLCHRFPALLGMLADGATFLSGICMLAPVLTEENLPRILCDVRGLRRWELQIYVDQLRAETSPAFWKDEPQSHPQLGLDVAVSSYDREAHAIALSLGEAPPASVPAPPDAGWGPRRLPPPKHATTRPLGVRVDAEFEGTLARARALLSHTEAGRDDAVLLRRALDLLIATEEKRRFGAEKRRSAKATPVAESVTTPPAPIPPEPAPVAPEPAPVAPATEPATEPHLHHPKRKAVRASVRRAVFTRDDGRCTFVAENGHTCGATYLVQLHHRIPWARGGADTLDNLTLHCATHNRLEARREGLHHRPAAHHRQWSRDPKQA